MEAVQDRLGHKDIKTTMNIYTHISKKRKAQGVHRVVEFMEFKEKLAYFDYHLNN